MRFFTVAVGSLCLSLSVGCASQDVEAIDDRLGAASSQGCVVVAPPHVSSLVASDWGVVFATEAVEMEHSTLLVQRAIGKGCELSADGQVPIAAASLLDVDDEGNVYVFPAQSQDPAVLATMLPEFFEGRASTVAKVDLVNAISKVVFAGRGIWDFGISPKGTSLWVTACGPTGIFSLTESGLVETLTPPNSLWEQRPSVLADDQTFWSVGVWTCHGDNNITPECGYALVRTTKDGSENVGTTVIDAGKGFEQTTLSRCGASVCGVLDSAVVLWDVNGQVTRTITLGDVSALPTEQIAKASGNRYGVYLLLRSDTGSRVVFVADQKQQ